jgi:hypothetical protein
LPWRYIALLGAIVAVIVISFNWRQGKRAAELRTEIRRVHGTELAGLRAEYEASRNKLQTLIQSAAGAPRDIDSPYVDPEMRFENLHDAPGLYLRLPLEHASDAAQIAAGAQLMEPDWIPGCLGLRPTTARELYEIGAFLLPSFLDTLDEENVLKLRVRQDTLQQRMTKDQPALRAAMQASWFMLVLQEGASRSDQPVRVFLWDLPKNKLMFRARVRAQGILLSSRILSQGVAAPSGSIHAAEGGAIEANDCSIASALRALTRRTQPPPAAAEAHE